jgi:hypothetical protein
MPSRMTELTTSWPIDDRPSRASVGVYRIVMRSDGVKPCHSGYVSGAHERHSRLGLTQRAARWADTVSPRPPRR